MARNVSAARRRTRQASDGGHAAAPDEHVLRLSAASTLFPHLPHGSRTPFRVGFAVLFLALVVFSLLRWQAPLIAVSALGSPIVFVFYLREADVFVDLPVRPLVLTVVVGVGLGVVFALLTGGIVATSYDVAIGGGDSDELALVAAVAVPTAGALLMLVPAVVVANASGNARVVGRFRDRGAGRDRVHRGGDADQAGAPVRHGAKGRSGPSGERASPRRASKVWQCR